MQPSNRNVDLDGLQPHPQNYNRHPAEQIRRIAKSLTKFGQVRSVVVWRNTLLAGHGVAEAARILNWRTVRADVLPDDYPEHLALAYIAADNELAKQGDPDMAQLAAILEESKAADADLLEAIGYSDKEFEALLKEVGKGAAAGVEDVGAQVDKADELRQKWGTAAGQLWRLGEHRLICGNCTDPATVARVMGGERAAAVVTDPPYGINREGIPNDDPEGLQVLFDGCLAVMPVTDAVMIAFQSPRLEWVWLDSMRAAGWKSERLLWMYDENDQTKPWHYWLMCSQAIRIASIGKPEWAECKAHHDTYVIGLSREFRAGGDGNEFAHASVKPVGVVADLIAHTTGIVYEPFSGSGTTIIACENLGRKCRACEISPAYVAVALERWAMSTGKTPVLVEG